MYKINDVVVNKKGQVCKIVDIQTMNVGAGDTEYYVLEPCFSDNNDSSKFYIPVSYDVILRLPIAKDEILKIIEAIPSIEVIWYVNPKVRRTEFKEMYDTGDPIKIFTLIKSFERKKEELKNEKKNLSFTDETFLKEIKHNIYNEFAVSLGKSKEEVEVLINEALNK